MNENKTINDLEINGHTDSDNFIQYLTFDVGSETYGIEVSNVKEVIEFDRVFKIAKVPDCIRGVVNLRGEVIPVVDLSSRFYGKMSEVTINAGIIFIEVFYNNTKLLIGAIIDEVREVVNIYKSNIESIPEFGAKIRPEFIKDIGKVDDEFIILLNIDTVLNVDELSSLDKNCK